MTAREDAMVGDIVIRILGPVDVTRGGVELPLGGPHARALVGALALAAGHVVSRAQLEDVLWGDAPPASAADTVHSYVSRVRHVVGPGVLEHDGDGYRLVVTREQVDATLFEDLLTRADAARADVPTCSALCRQALGLWRGEPFGDLADDASFRLESLRLTELRIATMELALACELELGRAGIVVAELESAVEEHPYREHLWHLLIDALARDGRRVEALRAAQRLRAVLAEAGLDPTEDLRALEQRILHPLAEHA